MRWRSAGLYKMLSDSGGSPGSSSMASAGYGGLQPYLSHAPWQLSALSSLLWTACQAHLEMEINCT